MGRIDFVKCDIEGAELLALRGMAKTLKEYQPAILMEVMPEWMKSFGHTTDDLIVFLKGCGYNSFQYASAELSPVEEKWDDAHLSDGVNVLVQKK